MFRWHLSNKLEVKTMSPIARRFVLACLIQWCLIAAAYAETLKFELVAVSAETYAQPHDIVLSPDGKALYVADNNNHRIVVLEPQTLQERGTFAQGEVSAPHDVDFDAQGRLLVADTGNSRIAIYAVQGASGRLVGSLRGRIRRPEGVAVHPDGRVFATGAASGNLVVYRDGNVIGEVGGFSSPHDVAFDPTGGIWVADAANDRMVRLNDALKVTAVLAGPLYDFSGPRYMDFDAAGRMYVADKYSHRIKVIAPDGRLIQVLGGATSGKGEGVFDRPEGVEIRGADIWFSDTYNDRIVRYKIMGTNE
jgi:DNA-binding beta-propeller fold protein YncE